MLQQNTTKRLGYWLLLLHLTFEEDMAAALADQNLDRRRWQVLHALAIGVGTTHEIDAAFAPFLAVDRLSTYAHVIEDFRARGWVRVSGGSVVLTPAGVTAHERAEAVVNDQAAGILDGISEPEFLGANDVLERIHLNMRRG
ncbi:hypothetical protein [Nocardia asteroides]|uniref:hypothetical protein n=1 Tax=Nocardia asteroides TaxID=1824 RepID=UPI001E2DA66C|nr:hypothetical protein [Nocardia asteroides]UGT55274.1 hypothetical protein LTT85_32680 [Nocardia asteroides]